MAVIRLPLLALRSRSSPDPAPKIPWPNNHNLTTWTKSLVSVSIWVKVTVVTSSSHPFFLLFSFTRCVILLNVRGRKWAKIRLPAVYPIHRPRRLRAAPPTFSIFLKLMRGRKIGSWKPNVVEIAKHRGASALSPERMTGKGVLARAVGGQKS